MLGLICIDNLQGIFTPTKKMRWIILGCFFVAYAQQVLEQRILIGASRYMRIIWNPNTTTSYIYAGTIGSDVYVLGVSTGKSYDVFCKRASTTQIITSPVGCDEYSNYVCENYDGLNRQKLLDNFNKSVIECEDREHCFGPIHPGGFVVSGTGPYCMAPSVTWLKTSTAKLVVTPVNCTSEFPGGVFTLNKHQALRTENMTVIYTSGSFAIALVRVQDLQKQIQLIKLVGSPYTILHESLETMEEISTKNYTLSSNCYLNVEKYTEDFTQLDNPVVPTNLDYYLQPEIPWYYKTRVCNHFVNRLNYLRDTTATYFPVNVPIGGRPIFKMKLTNSEIPIIPIEIKPRDEYKHYQSGCEHFYPKSSTFTSESNTIYYRNEPATMSCYAPIGDVSLISPEESFTRKYDYCFRLGGTVHGITQDACVVHQVNQKCKSGWLYWDNYCYYKYTEQIDRQRYKASLKESERVCNELGATSFFSLDQITVKWILGHYLYYKSKLVKVRVGISGQRCNCFYILDNTQEISESCDCNSLEFPLCRYHSKDFPLEFTKELVDSFTAAIYRDGQDGWPYNGQEIECESFAGSTGKYSESQTCIAPVVAASTIGESLRNPLLRFFKKCYVNGYCQDFLPYRCNCSPGYGPFSNLNDPLDPHTDHPCGCPALYVSGSTIPFQIGDTLYENNTLGVCNNYKAGYCDLGETNNSFALGVCKSIMVFNLWLGASPSFDRIPIYLGKSLASKTPIYFPGTDTQLGFCNGRGIICPTGEVLNEQVLDTSRVGLFGRYECPAHFVGCVCFNGWGGESCTSIVPEWFVKFSRFKIFTPTGLYYYNFPYKINVTRVEGLDEYEIRDSLDIPCPGCTRGLYITSTTQITSEIKIYKEDFPICGWHAHLGMNRYFANEEWHSCYSALVVNNYTFARLGSTTTACQCDVHYTGKRCQYGISSIRFENDKWGKYACGTNTLPPRGRTNGLDSCECNNEFGFEGEACQCRHSCGKYGVCKSPKFRFGQCSFDLDAIQENEDAVRALNQFNGQQYYSYTVELEPTILYLNNSFWEFSVGSVLFIENINNPQLNMELGVIPFTLNYTCESSVSIPRKMRVVEAFIQNTSGVFLDTVNFPSLPACSSGQLPCVINSTFDSEIESLDTVLFEGLYPQSVPVNNFIVTKISTTPVDTAYGKFDCTDVIDLIIESALVCLGLVIHPQCPHTIHKYSLGTAYGLFWNKHISLKFDTDEWTAEHYTFLKSFLHLGWNDTSWDYYASQLVSGILANSPASSSVEYRSNSSVYTNSSGTIYATGYNGNYYRNLSLLNYSVVSGLPGYTFSLGENIGDLRSVEFINTPVNTTQIAIIAPNGRICGGFYYPLEQGSNVTILCELGNLPENEGESLFRALHAGTLSQYLNHTWQDWTVWYIASPHNSSTWNFALGYFGIAPNEKWIDLKTSIMISRLFPGNTQANMTNEDVRDLYNTYLSPRRCADDSTCEGFARRSSNSPSSATCVYQPDYYRLWLNGQDKPPVIALGDEGGCDCRYHIGVWEDTSHCILCKKGYGPLTDEEWVRYLNSPLELGFNGQRPDDCTIPIDEFSTSGVSFCSGHGDVSYSNITSSVTLPIWKWKGRTITPRCRTIGGFELQESAHPSVIVYGAAQEIVIVDETIYTTQTNTTCEDIQYTYPSMRYRLNEFLVEKNGQYRYWLVTN